MHTPQRPNGDIFHRMVSGAAYMPDAECGAQYKRIHAATVLAEEHYARGEQAQAMHVYREHLGHLGEHSHIRPGARFDYGVNTYIGDGSFFNFGCVFLDVCPIRIGSTVLVGNNVQFLTPTHPLNPVDRAAYWEGGKPITVEDNVWIGGGAIILGGVTIGKNSVIGAGTVVTKDVPENSLVMGNPGRVIRTLDENERPAYPHTYSAEALEEARAFYADRNR